MAFLSESEREAIVERTRLAPATEHTITRHDELEAVLTTVRERGYAFSREDPARRRRNRRACLGPGGKVVGEVGVSVPAQRFRAADEARLAVLVKECAAAVTTALGG